MNVDETISNNFVEDILSTHWFWYYLCCKIFDKWPPRDWWYSVVLLTKSSMTFWHSNGTIKSMQIRNSSFGSAIVLGLSAYIRLNLNVHTWQLTNNNAIRPTNAFKIGGPNGTPQYIQFIWVLKKADCLQIMMS